MKAHELQIGKLYRCVDPRTDMVSLVREDAPSPKELMLHLPKRTPLLLIRSKPVTLGSGTKLTFVTVGGIGVMFLSNTANVFEAL